MMANPPRHLLLDIGMVLVRLDFKPLGDRMRTLARIEPAQLQAILTGNELVQEFETGKLSETEFYEEVCRRLGTNIPRSGFFNAWNSVFADQLLSDHVLATLAGKAHLWAVSNTNRTHFDFLARSFTFLRHFEGLILSYEVGALKPDTRIFEQALRKSGAPASDLLFVDDQEINVKAAGTLGIEGFTFLNPGQFENEMRNRGLL
jgi:putative hydrolase of the HAD superfamily